MTPSELKELSVSQLHQYFEREARYFADAPISSQYGIRVGSRHICAPSTNELLSKFIAFVRK